METSHQPTNNGEASKRETEDIYVKMDWDKLAFDVIPTDYMYIMKSNEEDGSFSNGALVPFGTIDINPHSTVLNYGQGLFEGMKAYRTPDGEVQIFRPEENALRMRMGAERLLMPSPSVEQYVDAVKQVVNANKRWVPPHGKGALYIRPLLFGSGSVMGISPAPQCTFLIYTNPISNIYKGRTTSLSLLIDNKLPRAYPGGTGGVKNISNYSPVFQVVKEAKAKGFSDVLFLDAVEHKYIEEVSSCNAFIVKGKVISTAPTLGTILPGITRKSIIELASDLGYQVKEHKISVKELLQANEVFCTGTAVGISDVGSITYKNKCVKFKTGTDTVTQKLYDLITGIQTGLLEDKKGWVVKID
ncbi:branched-chain-amino-acid transaminase [Trifolium repens]|nr:branched-chain amino acid transaminase [Trifolium repens]WJX33278.1 branched-chain-amino-acid transaminase [Trifolium repens]